MGKEREGENQKERSLEASDPCYTRNNETFRNIERHHTRHPTGNKGRKPEICEMGKNVSS